MIFDFSFILVVATFVTGVIWGIDVAFFKKERIARGRASGIAAEEVREPIVVEYARSFFPVILIVLIIRSFLFEPFRIPSDSMMPTLLQGDFIFVNKFAYGLKLPVLNIRIIPVGEPRRGDVIVFRKPTDPGTNYIKRLIGLPGDRVVVRDDVVFINDRQMTITLDGTYPTPRQVLRTSNLGIEDLDGVRHRVLLMPGHSTDFSETVPAGTYFFMGDNRDNSQDSRFSDVGFVPEHNLVGKAVWIWLNWDIPNAPIWDRIGDPIR